MQRFSGAERIIEMNGREGRDTRGFVMALVITGGTLEEAGRSCEGFHGAHPYCHGPFFHFSAKYRWEQKAVLIVLISMGG